MRYLLFLVMAAVLVGCGTTPQGDASKQVVNRLESPASDNSAAKNEKPEPAKHGLQIIKVVDEQGRERTEYIYVPRGVPKTLTEAISFRDSSAVLEMARTEWGENNLKKALFGARWVTTAYPSSNFALDGYFLLGEIYEDTKSFSQAFMAYQEIVSRWPEHPRRQEAVKRRLRIAGKVKKLYLVDKNLSDITFLKSLTKVETLDLLDNQINDVSVLAKLTQLKSLNLYNNHLTDVSALAELKQLTGLNLGNNQITNLSALAKLTKLEVLYLRNNPNLTKAEIDKLQKALPKCEINSNPKK